jgi:hypothetical protein
MLAPYLRGLARDLPDAAPELRGIARRLHDAARCLQPTCTTLTIADIGLHRINHPTRNQIGLPASAILDQKIMRRLLILLPSRGQ